MSVKWICSSTWSSFIWSSYHHIWSPFFIDGHPPIHPPTTATPGHHLFRHIKYFDIAGARQSVSITWLVPKGRARNHYLLKDNYPLKIWSFLKARLLSFLPCNTIYWCQYWAIKLSCCFTSWHCSCDTTWCTADPVFSDKGLVVMSQCILKERFAEGWDLNVTAVCLSIPGFETV